MKTMHFPPRPGTGSHPGSPSQGRAKCEEEALFHRRTLCATGWRMARHAADAEDLVMTSQYRSTRHSQQRKPACASAPHAARETFVERRRKARP